jgi:O-antigen/teichoic acid export membrane protein
MSVDCAPATIPLDRSLVSGLAWTAGFRWIGQLISWSATLYAAHLLAPSDYGLVSMAVLGIGLARIVQDFGLDGILVQDTSIVGEAQAGLAGLIVVLGVALWALFAVLAGPMALFFREPRVALIVIVIGGVFVTDALQVVPRAQMQRQLQYSQLASTAFLQVVVNQAALVIAVRSGLGYWSLVAGTLAGEIAVTVVLIYLSPYQVAWPRRIRALAKPLKNGSRLLTSRVAWYGYINADQTIIGRLLGTDALGVYSFATTFSSLPQQEIGSIVSRVAPGIFTRVQDQPHELRRYFLRLTEFVTVLSFPMSVGMGLTADLVMPLALGPQWTQVVTPLRLLCAYSVFQASQVMLSHVLMWTGQFRVFMWCSILAGVVMPPVLYGAAYFFGIVGIGWAWVIVMPIVNIPAFVFAFRTAQMTVFDWLGALKPAGFSCAMMAVGVLGVRTVLPPTLNSWLVSGITIGVGAVVYVATMCLAFRGHVRMALEIARTLRDGRPESPVAPLEGAASP